MGNTETHCCSQKKDARYEVDGEVMNAVTTESAAFPSPDDKIIVDKTKIEAADDASTITPPAVEAEKEVPALTSVVEEVRSLEEPASEPKAVQDQQDVQEPAAAALAETVDPAVDPAPPAKVEEGFEEVTVTEKPKDEVPSPPKAPKKKKAGKSFCCGSKSKVLEDSDNEVEAKGKEEPSTTLEQPVSDKPVTDAETTDTSAKPPEQVTPEQPEADGKLQTLVESPEEAAAAEKGEPETVEKAKEVVTES
mmetsp:Transcript_96234/g.167133  ORF Transcript_96234/g.167133 Transcript_96234/m.167133 type:complete len:250 (+) Transcript_96234:68-817(+)